MIKIVLLGAGNLGSLLTAKLLNNKAINLVQVYNRSIEKIKYLKNKIEITDNLSELKKADIYILCVSDNAISAISSKLNFPTALVLHTSGGTSLNELKSNSKKGVMYFLQTFSKDRNIDFSTIPACLEAENEEDLKLLSELASGISKKIYVINSDQRQHLHVAAVFVNNFVNYMYKIGNDICFKTNVPFDILKPLILETASKIDEISPFEAQTGPARRNDTKTIEKHKILLLKNQKEIYTLLTDFIIQSYE